MPTAQERPTFLDPDNGTGLVYNNGQGVLSYLAPRANLDPHGGIAADVNTLATPDVSLSDWVNGLVGGGTLSRLPAQATIDTFLDAVWVNAQQDVSGDVALTWRFTPNPGCTSLSFKVPMMMPSATGTKNVTLRIYTSGSAQLLTQTFSVTTSVTRCALPVTGLTPGTLYLATVHVNEAGQQANPYIGRVQLVPTGGTGVFSGPFVRLRIQSSMVSGNIQSGWNNGLYPYLSPNADIFVHTDACRIAVESYASSMAGNIAFLYSGQPHPTNANGSTIPNGTLGIDDIPLPFTGSADTVTIRAGTSLGNLGNVLGKYQGIFPRCFYLPVSASFIYAPFNTRDLCICVGDSLLLGNASGFLPFEAWGSLFRLRYAGNVVFDAHNSRTLFDYASTTAQQEAFAKYLGRCQPKLVIWDLGVNDYISHPWPGGATGYLNYAAALANVIDLMRSTYSPTTVHCIKTLCVLGNEADRGNGTAPNFRTAQAAIANDTRSAYCFSIDGFAMITTGDLDADNLHFKTVGQAKVANAVVAGCAAQVPPEM